MEEQELAVVTSTYLLRFKTRDGREYQTYQDAPNLKHAHDIGVKLWTKSPLITFDQQGVIISILSSDVVDVSTEDI